MKDRVEQLDGLRGIFSVLVIAHHHNAFKTSPLYDNFFVINSNLFVDFFFVLSGFVIALNYVDRIQSSNDFFIFLKKRFIRLYPLLFFTEIVFLIANLLGEKSPMKNVGSLGSEYYFSTTLDTITFMGSTPILGAWIANNYPSWSISAEMISYIIFGIVILLLPKLKYLAFTILLIISGIFIFSRGEYLLAYDYGFVRGLLCFCLGIFTHLLLRRKTFYLSFLEIPFLIILVSAMYCAHHWEWNLWKLTFPFLFAIGIVIFTSSTGVVTKMLSTKPFQYLGKISYSIYLNHAIVLIFVNVALFRLLKSPKSEMMIAVSLVTSIILTVCYSHFTFEIIEKRFSKFLRTKWG
ncbi:acyltransferase family protein [Dyadobacter arcticus]|uniref:Peptidoglycan/LPS O-acetylase OafA/YrhL n=1 Tax=Dyadobacter arcticus TaxID=1078754 RepID=A0ABX0UK13_9BACT|nr:acyltransferase [Dyadobacter arcticus]NIJ53358.1 peptidoglycan/LPS O-acetylase OafA/YrhL [Dyadobacter arcticus]